MAAPSPSGRRHGSIRLRATAVSIAVVGVTLLIGALGLLQVLRSSLLADIDRSAGQRADELGSLVATGSLPSSLPGVGEDTTIAQVVAADGTVLSASRNLQGKPALDFLVALGRRERLGTASGRPVGDLDHYRVAVRPAGPDVVYVALSTDPANATLRRVAIALAAGGPFLVLLVSVLAWQVVGRALRPVELIRAEVADITAQALERRVPVPGAGDEVGRLASTMNDMLDRLEDARRRDRQFLSDVSHELRSPLAALRTTTEVGLAHPDRADWPALASAIHAEAFRMQHLIDDLLAVARQDETGGLTVPRQWVDLDEIVLEHVHELRTRLATGTRVDLSSVSGGRVVGDEMALRRVVRNLVDNAVRHARSTVTVALAEVRDPPRIRLSVEDDGPGIPDGERERVFERFHRLDDARSRDMGGSGLGLAIVREVVAAHGGAVWADAGRSGGARLVVELPLPPSPAAEP